MAADKIAFDYSAMERRPGDTIRAEDWNAAMRTIADLVAAVNAAVGSGTGTVVPQPPPPAPLPGPTPRPAVAPTVTDSGWVQSSPLDPAPSRIGTITIGQGLRAVAIDANYAYVACQQSFRIFDRSRYDHNQAFNDPANSLYLSNFIAPAPVGQVPCPDAEDIFLAGGYAYIAGGQQGLIIVNIADPRQPRVESTLPLSASIRRVCVVGDIAYVISYEQSLQIVSVADKQHPTLLSQLFMEMPNGVVVRGNCAYVACDDCGYCIVDVTNPSAPTYLCRYAPDFANGKDICLSGSLAYIGDAENHFIRLVDVSQPQAPRTVNMLALDPNLIPGRMLVRGDALLVAAGWQGLQIYDISNGGVPDLVTVVNSSISATAVDERYAYLATDAGTLEVYDVRPPVLALPAGSVGIGTERPQARLEVKGGRTVLQQEPWQDVPLVGDIRPGQAGLVQFFKDSQGIVHLRGGIERDPVGNVGIRHELFSLPAGYQPQTQEMHLVVMLPPSGATAETVVGRVLISPDGTVALEGSDPLAVNFDGITFRGG